MPDNFSMGEWVGEEYTTLLVSHMPAHAHSGWTAQNDVQHTHAISGTGTGSGATDFRDLSHAHIIEHEQWDEAQGGAGHKVLQPDNEGGSSGNFAKLTEISPPHLHHNHGFSVTVSLSGSIGTDSPEHYHAIAVEGSSAPHSSMQPTTFVRKIIYAGV